jgi:DNA polymerase
MPQAVFIVESFASWRTAAREALQRQLPPEYVQWNHDAAPQQTLFADESSSEVVLKNTKIHVPKHFIELAQKVACHSDPIKWSLLYQALWRLQHGERHLLNIESDPLVHQLKIMQRHVTRDCHKMKAFVRFRFYQDEQCYIAWYEPQHNVIELTANFFKQRFSTMTWLIFTPYGFIGWNQQQLIHSTQVVKPPENDDLAESLWLTYYQAIFNPARIKTKAMLKEMPRCYWKNLPEAKVIKQLLVDAPDKVNQMLSRSAEN